MRGGRRHEQHVWPQGLSLLKQQIDVPDHLAELMLTHVRAQFEKQFRPGAFRAQFALRHERIGS